MNTHTHIHNRSNQIVKHRKIYEKNKSKSHSNGRIKLA